MPILLLAATDRADSLIVTNTSTRRLVNISLPTKGVIRTITPHPSDGSVAIGYDAPPRVAHYTAGGTLLPSLTPTPPSTPYGCAFSPDGAILVFAHADAAPYLTLYDTATGTALPPPTAMPPGGCYGCAFSPDGTIFAVAHGSSPFVTCYNTSTWEKITGILPAAGTGRACAFSPDGSVLAVAHDYSPFVTRYNTSTWGKLPNPSALPTANGQDCAFSPAAPLLAVLQSGAPYLIIYDTTNWTKLAVPATTLPGTASRCTFNQDGTLLAVAHQNAPFLTVYETQGWTVRTDLSLPLAANARGAAVGFSIAAPLLLEGTVRDLDGYPVARTVRVYERDTGNLCATATSSAVDGSYSISVYEGDKAYDVQFMADPAENLNDLFFAKAIAGPP